jgi:hypothetical protein
MKRLHTSDVDQRLAHQKWIQIKETESKGHPCHCRQLMDHRWAFGLKRDRSEDDAEILVGIVHVASRPVCSHPCRPFGTDCMEDLLSQHHISPFVWRIVGMLWVPVAVAQMAYYRPLDCTMPESASVMLPWSGIICGPVWSRFRSRVLHLPRFVHHIM